MKKVFDIHAHYLFPIKIEKQVEILKKEMDVTGTEKICFLSIPNDVRDERYHLDYTQNVKALFLKHSFGQNGYAFAGLEHPLNSQEVSKEFLSENFYKQAVEYYENGFDGMKMLEGYPSVRKHDKIALDDEVYDKYYEFLELNQIPVIMHLANPQENWDIKKADKYAIEQGRVYDSSYPTKDQLEREMFGILKKHRRLKLGLAHFGFMSYDIKMAERFLSYENTFFDITPGGEQLINMSKSWDNWGQFFQKYQDRIVYGTDYYAFPDENEVEWEICFTRRPNLIRQLFETDQEYDYLDSHFKGVSLDETIIDKIYSQNALKILGCRKDINYSYLIEKALGTLSKNIKHVKYLDDDM